MVLNEPTVIAVNRNTHQIEAIGRNAREMLGRTPRHLKAVEPLKDGVISHFELAEKMLQHFIRKASRGRCWVSPSIVVGAPSNTTQVERRAIEEAAYRAKASRVHIVMEPLAAAIGAGLPVDKARGVMVVDVGSGTTDIAVITLAGVAFSCTVKVAGDEFDNSIVNYLRQERNFIIGKRTAERVKIEIGSAHILDKPLSMEAHGKTGVESIPFSIRVSDEEVREALATPLTTILGAIRYALERTPPELSADVIENGIMLTGGGALLRNLDKLLMRELQLPVRVADEPLLSVALGTGRMLTDTALLGRVMSAANMNTDFRKL